MHLSFNRDLKMKQKSAQVTLEYVGLWILLATALIVMAVFVRGHIQARQKQEGEKISRFLYIPGKTDFQQKVVTTTITSSISDDIHSQTSSKVNAQSFLNMTTDVSP